LIDWILYKGGECYKHLVLADIVLHSPYEGREKKHLGIYNFDGSIIGEIWLGERSRWG